MASILGDDIQLDFATNDIVFDNDNDFKIISGEDNLTQAIIARIMTSKGDLLSHSSYGSELYLLIGESLTDETLTAAGTYVYQALSEEPRISSIDDITIDSDVINDEPTLLISITVTPIESDTELNLVINFEL